MLTFYNRDCLPIMALTNGNQKKKNQNNGQSFVAAFQTLESSLKNIGPFMEVISSCEDLLKQKKELESQLEKAKRESTESHVKSKQCEEEKENLTALFEKRASIWIQRESQLEAQFLEVKNNTEQSLQRTINELTKKMKAQEKKIESLDGKLAEQKVISSGLEARLRQSQNEHRVFQQDIGVEKMDFDGYTSSFAVNIQITNG